MKENQFTAKPQKVRVIANGDIYYTFKHWETKEVDGVEFIGVNKFEPSPYRTQIIYYLRKDSVQYIK